MKTREKIRLLLFPAILAAFISLLSDCAVKPDEKAVKDPIIQYFEARKYRVVGIDIGGIASIPLSSKVYMGAEGYTVEVRSITLEIIEDSGAPAYYRKGQRLTFKDAVVQIKAGEKVRWSVLNISGIPVI